MLECGVRKRLEKRMEVSLSSVGPYMDNMPLKIRPATPQSIPNSPENLAELANEFAHSIQYIGNLDQIEVVKNSIAMKLIRSYKDKSTGLLNLVFDFIFWPSKSFMLVFLPF